MFANHYVEQSWPKNTAHRKWRLPGKRLSVLWFRLWPGGAGGFAAVPKTIRDSLGMKTGDRMSFTLMPDGVVVMRVKNKRVSDLAGLLYKKGRKTVPVGQLSR